jgi:hypothetical protein
MRPNALRLRHLGSALLTCALLALLGVSARAQDPNIIFFAGDDWGWPYFGFEQRWLAAKVTGTCEGGSQNGQSCRGNSQCPGGTCDSEYVGEDPTNRFLEYLDPVYLLPDFPAPGRPPVDRLMTPALDWLAANGNFWPVAHNSATISQPAFCVLMTGLYPEDWVLTEARNRTTSPVLPEWLPTQYLTLGAGKWQYGLSHVTATLDIRRPWDREVGQGGNAGEGGRIILKPYQPGDKHAQALQGLSAQRVKDFIACATCQDPSKCAQPGSADAEPDSARMGPRTQPGQCTPQPFFVQFSPFIPHLNYKFDDNCPLFPRDAAQCAIEPWKTHSLYCNDPSGFDWSCENYATEISEALRPTGVPSPVLHRRVEYIKHINTYDRAIDEMLVYLKCPNPSAPDCGADLFENTVILFSADHGWELPRSKGRFTENAQRTPKVLYDPRPGNTLPMSPEGCAGQPGCRSEFAHAIDIRATLKDLSDSTFDCDPLCTPCDSSCPNACPCARPDGLSRYSEGKSLRAPVVRSCNGPNPTYAQCVFGREKGSQGISNVKKGWDVLAEVTDGANPAHLCKLYVTCGRQVGLFDLQSDPNEKTNLEDEPGTFCGSRLGDLVDILRGGIQDRGWYNACFEQQVP